MRLAPTAAAVNAVRWMVVATVLVTLAAVAPLSAITALVTLSLSAPSPAAAQGSALQYTLPPGWKSSADAGVQTLIPASEPAGTVQALLLEPKPLLPDFEAQFDAERSALEAHWGLSAPQAVAPQRGRLPAGPHAAHFASYSTAAGPRYMSFLGIGRNGKFVLMVFVAASDEAFNRLAPQATQIWQGLQVPP